MCQEDQDVLVVKAFEDAMSVMLKRSDSTAKTFLGQTMKKIGLTEHWFYYEWDQHILGRESGWSRVAREKLQFALEVRGRKWNPAWAAVLHEALQADLK